MVTQQLAYDLACQKSGLNYSLVARIALQVAEYCELAISRFYEACPKGIPGSLLWHLQGLIPLYRAIAYGRYAEQNWHEENWGEAVAHSRRALEFLKQCNSHMRNQGAPLTHLREIVNKTNVALNEQHKSFEAENDAVYFSGVPSLADRPPYYGTAVKPPTPYDLPVVAFMPEQLYVGGGHDHPAPLQGALSAMGRFLGGKLEKIGSGKQGGQSSANSQQSPASAAETNPNDPVSPVYYPPH
eukprot:Platyproteum_vivax@DN5240_c0_g1_i2.p1